MIEPASEQKLDKNIKDNALARLGVMRPHLVFVIIAVVLIIGIFSFTNFKMELFPNMNLPYVLVMYNSEPGGAVVTPDDAAEFTSYVEDNLQMASGVRSISSTTMSSVVTVIILFVEFTGSTNADTGVVNIIQTLDRASASSDRPAASSSFDSPMIMKISMDMMPVFVFTTDLGGADTDLQARDYYRKYVEPELKKADGVAIISSPFDSTGNVDGFTIVDGDSNKNAYTFSIQKASDAVTTDTVANILVALANIEKATEDIAEGKFKYTPTLDQGQYITESVGAVMENLLLGALFAIIILFFFMRSWKMTLAIAISIPFSIVGTFVLMYFMGIGLNVVSMSGLALVVGLLVDNSIIVLENIVRLKSKGLPIREAALKGASQILMAVFAATITTICVFFPMFFVTGLIMEVFMDLVWVIIFSLASSLIVAIMFLPAIIATFRIGEKPQHKIKWLHAVNNFFTRVDQKIGAVLEKPKKAVTGAYDKALGLSVKYKWAALAMSLVIFVASVFLVFINGFVLMPSMDSGEFSLAVGINREYANYGVLGFDAEDIALVDAGDWAAAGALPVAEGLLQKRALVFEAKSKAIAKGVYGELKTKLGNSIETISMEYSTGMSGMAAIFSGGQASLEMNFVLKENRSLSTSSANQIAYETVLKYITDQDMIPEGSDALKPTHFVSEVSTSDSMAMMVTDKVIVTLAAPAYGTLTEQRTALETTLDAVEEKLWKIPGVLRVSNSYDSMVVARENKRMIASLEVTVNKNDTLSKVQTRVDNMMATNEIVAILKANEVDQIEDGFAAQFNDSFVQMILAILIGFVLVYLVMVAIFQSFKLPLIVMITVPLAFTGGFILLAIAGMPLSIPAMIGLLILMGVVTNNGIVMIDYINKAREDGLTIREAVIAGAKTRARPILMTALSTIIALVPLAVGMGASGALMQPLAIVSIGGLLYATVMSLLVVPAFYSIAYFMKDKQEQKGVKKNEQVNSSQLENEQNSGGSTQVLPRVRAKKSKK